MDLDEMLETWRTQDTAPLYGLNRDALERALAAEEAGVRRVRRRDLWIVCIAGAMTTVLAGFWLVVLLYQSDEPVIYTVAGGVGFGMVAAWVGAYCVSRWHEAKRERNFGNTLQAEVRRTLSRIDAEIARFGRWTAASLQIAPIMVGALLIMWSIGRSQGDGSGESFGIWWLYPIVAFWTVYLVRTARRYAAQKLEPRRRRLRELLAALDADE